MRHSLLAAVLPSVLLAGSVCSLASPVRPVYEIQGAGHTSPYLGDEVRTYGFVTAVTAGGFFLQDAEGDDDPATSDGVFVDAPNEPPGVEVGDWLELSAEVAEFTPGGAASNNLSITRLENAVYLPHIFEAPDAQPVSVMIGAAGRVPPAEVIDNDNFEEFDPEEDGLDFFESLEGMLVTLPAPFVICPSTPDGEVYVVTDGGAGASGMSRRGTLKLSPDDYHPERIQIQEMPDGPGGQSINVGDRLEDVTGVMSYDGMYEVLARHALAMAPGGIVKGSTDLLPFPERLRVATYDLQDLDAHVEDPARLAPGANPHKLVDDDLGTGRFAAIAEQIVQQLGSPDLIALQGVQDDDGTEISPIIRANKTLLSLTSAILRSGGPVYRFVAADPKTPAIIDDGGTPLDPSDDEVFNPSGGEPGGNQRNVILYNPQRVGDPLSSATIEDGDPGDGDTFANTPEPLVATFAFQGTEVTVINVHLHDRVGGSSVFGTIQPATELQNDSEVNGGVEKRMAQVALIRNTTDQILAADPEANLIVLGNFNDPEFVSPTLAFGKRLTNLAETLEDRERYTIIAQGSSMALDHIFVSRGLMARSPRCEVVHVNCEFAKTPSRASDHDPLVASLSLGDPFTFDARTMDGSGNNLLAPSYGQATQPYLRSSQDGLADFADSLGYPRGSTPALNPDPLYIGQSDLPSARLVSNLLCQHELGGVESRAGLSSWTWQWGQFIDHDFGLSGGPGPDEPREFFPIPVPRGDPQFDPFNTGLMVIPFARSGTMPGAGVNFQRETPNTITSFIDGSAVYGSDELRAANLRAFIGGKLATQPGPDGDLLPFNLYGRANANDLGLPGESLFLSGDVRANEQCALTAVHTLFVREHNRLADEIAARDFPGADLGDPAIDAEIYHHARKWIGAFLQNITYREFLPAVMGPTPLPPYDGYHDTINAALSQEFANAAYRVGHTMVTPELLRLDGDGKPIPEGHLPLRNAFFNPPEITEIGIDPYLRGLAQQVQQEIDRFVIEDLRSFLFGPPGAGGLDLAALNIQRGRDHGMPPINTVREAFGLPDASGYDELSSDPETLAGFESAYGPGEIDQVDLWIAGISEDHLGGSQLGPTFHAIWVEQFTRLRDGDRFWFEADPFFAPEEVDAIRATTLADIIRRNSDADVQDNVFFVPYRLEIISFEFARSTNTITIGWRSRGGVTYELQASDDFGKTPFATIATATGEPGTTSVSFVDPAAVGKQARAYRVVQP